MRGRAAETSKQCKASTAHLDFIDVDGRGRWKVVVGPLFVVELHLGPMQSQMQFGLFLGPCRPLGGQFLSHDFAGIRRVRTLALSEVHQLLFQLSELVLKLHLVAAEI